MSPEDACNFLVVKNNGCSHPSVLKNIRNEEGMPTGVIEGKSDYGCGMSVGRKKEYGVLVGISAAV